MSLPEGTRYRVKTFKKTGKKVRLAFDPNGDVIEAKSLPKKSKKVNKRY